MLNQQSSRMPVPLAFFFLLLSSMSSSDSMANGRVDEKRRFEVRDSVEMSYFGTINESHPRLIDDDGIASPDGRYVVKLTHRGVLPLGVTEGTIWVFEVADIVESINDPERDAPTPFPLVRMSAAINGLIGDFRDRGNILFQLKWSGDSRHLMFLGRDDRENRQLFRVDVHTRDIESLTLENQDVVAYSHSGGSIAYLARTDVE